MDYEITYNTQSIIPIDDFTTKVIDDGNNFLVNDNSMSVIERSCEYYGSSYEGRKIGTKSLLGITHKSPIIIEESSRIIFFPTKSPNRDDCVWLNLNQIQKYYGLDGNTSRIIFKDGTSLDLNISIASLTNQILRSSRLKFVLEERQGTKKDINF